MSALTGTPELLWLWQVTDEAKQTWWVLTEHGPLSATRPWNDGHPVEPGVELRRAHDTFGVWFGQRGRGYRVAVPSGWGTEHFKDEFSAMYERESFLDWLETDPLRQPVMADLDALLGGNTGASELDALLEEDDDPLGLGSFG